MIDMANMINRDTTLIALRIIEEESKRNRNYAACGGVRRAIKVVEELPVSGDIGVVSPKAFRFRAVEPWFKNGVTGRDVYRCSACNTVIGKTDAYCKHCGRKLEDRYE